MKKTLISIFFIILIFIAVSISRKFFVSNRVDSAEEFIIIGAGVHILEQPSVRSRKIGLLRFGQTIYKPERKCDSEGNVWYRVLCDDNCYEKYEVDEDRHMNQGWVSGKYLSPYKDSDRDAIILKICENKFNQSVSFGDLVELKNFIDEIIQDVSDVKITSNLVELRNSVLDKSLQLITDDKRNTSPYKEWFERYNQEYKETNSSSSTYGANSPVISNVKGGVNIIYGADEKQKIRVTYYRLKGSAADFLVKGLLSPEWEKILGGQQEIMNNKVLRKVKEVLNMFSMEPIGDWMGTGDRKLKNDLHGYAEKINYKGNVFDDKTGLWNSYLGGIGSFSVEFPDKEGMNTVINTDNWPSDYQLFYSCWENKFGERGESYPVVWKYLTKKDIDSYNSNIQKYFKYIESSSNTSIGGHSMTRGDYNNMIIKPIKKLTNKKFPKDFLIVYGNEAIHGGWEWIFTLRGIELEIAVIENISNNAISIANITYSELVDDQLVAYDAVSRLIDDEQLKSTVISNTNMLSQKEKIIVPLRISFVNNFNRLNCKQPSLNEGKVFLMNGVEADNKTPKKIYKKREAMSENVYPEITERYNYGTSWKLHSLDIDGKSAEIRQATFNQFSLYFGNEKGSCPFVYTKEDGTGLWRSQGHMLLGATSKELMRDDVEILSEFSGILKIQENEDEISFIEDIYIEEVDKNKKKIIHYPENSSRSFEVVRGKPKILKFGMGTPEPQSVFHLHMKGYYLPFSRIKFDQIFLEN